VVTNQVLAAGRREGLGHAILADHAGEVPTVAVDLQRLKRNLAGEVHAAATGVAARRIELTTLFIREELQRRETAHDFDFVLARAGVDVAAGAVSRATRALAETGSELRPIAGAVVRAGVAGRVRHALVQAPGSSHAAVAVSAAAPERAVAQRGNVDVARRERRDALVLAANAVTHVRGIGVAAPADWAVHFRHRHDAAAQMVARSRQAELAQQDLAADVDVVGQPVAHQFLVSVGVAHPCEDAAVLLQQIQRRRGHARVVVVDRRACQRAHRGAERRVVPVARAIQHAHRYPLATRRVECFDQAITAEHARQEPAHAVGLKLNTDRSSRLIAAAPRRAARRNQVRTGCLPNESQRWQATHAFNVVNAITRVRVTAGADHLRTRARAQVGRELSPVA
jgi:hypothetical protein